MGFYIANLGRDRLILGYPWFQKFNPQFNWKTNTLEGEEVEIDTAGYRTRVASTLRAVETTCYVTAGTFARRGLGFNSKDTKESDGCFEVLSTKSKKRT